MAWLTRSPLWGAPLTAGRQIDYPAWHSYMDVAAAEGRVVPLHVLNPAHANTDRGDSPRPILYDGISRAPLIENANALEPMTLKGDNSVFNGKWYLDTPQPITVTNATDSGVASTVSGNKVRLTVSSTAGMVTGQSRKVNGIVGTTEANLVTGVGWTITVINGTTIDLDESTYANAYVSGGLVEPAHGGLIIPNSQFRDALSLFMVVNFTTACVNLGAAEFLLWSNNTSDGTTVVTQLTKTATNKILWQVGTGLNATSTTTISAGTYIITAIYDPDDDDFATGKGLQLWINGVLEDEDDTDADGAGPNPPQGIVHDTANIWHVGTNAGGGSGITARLAALAIFQGNIAKATGGFLANLHNHASDDYT